MMKTAKVLMIGFVLLGGLGMVTSLGQAMLPQLLSAFTMSLNTNPPSYIKDVVAYKEGDGLVMYLTMADANGALTRADGTLTVTIREDWFAVWANSYQVSREHFQTAKVGMGAFERTTLLLSLGRIRTQDMVFMKPSFTSTSRSHHLTIEVRFTTNGTELKGTQDIWL